MGETLTMINKQTLLSLAKRCEEADGPCRELDRDLATALKGRVGSVIGYDGHPASVGISPNYTSSIDAATQIVPEGWWMHYKSQHRNKHDGIKWAVNIKCEHFAKTFMRHAKTEPLTILAASLRAIASELED